MKLCVLANLYGNLSLEEEKDAKILAYSIGTVPSNADFENGKYKNDNASNNKETKLDRIDYER